MTVVTNKSTLPAAGKKAPKRKLRNRWRQHERYGQLMFPRDNKSEAEGLIRRLHSEPSGYHQGALIRGNSAMDAKKRALARKDRVKTRRKLEGFMAVAS